MITHTCGTLQIISARELPKPHDRKTFVQYGHEEDEFSKSAAPFNGYVTASIYGAPGDSKEFKTHSVGKLLPNMAIKTFLTNVYF